LGTVQFGLPYGVANRAGQVSRDEAAAILATARTAGVDTLDTAIAYGESEARLGELGVSEWRVISKLPAIPADVVDVEAWVQQSIAGSRRRLGVSSLYAILLHLPEQLLGPAGTALYRALLAARERGEVRKIGISIYGPQDLEPLAGRFQLDLVQAPFNILDRRMDTSGWLQRLREAGTEVHARSLFLQGLLLMPASGRLPKFNRWQSLWTRWDDWLRANDLTALEACVRFAVANDGFDRLVVGVDSRAQLEEILRSLTAAPLEVPGELMSTEADLINPARWNLL